MSMPARAASNMPTQRAAAGNALSVMVVDDSAVVRGLVSRWIDEEPGLKMVARHANGKLAVDDIAKSKPDVVVLDIEMPIMDGLTALPQLVKNLPSVKIIMASTLTLRNAEISMKALSLGATDYVAKPESNRGVTTSQDFRHELMRKIKAVAGVRSQISRPASPRPATARSTKAPAPTTQGKGLTPKGKPIQLRQFSKVPPRIFAVGSSTGGPQALLEVMKTVSPALDSVPTVITQHMPATFTTILANHIGEAARRKSKEGEDGEKVLPGHIYLAPGGKHMVLEQRGGGIFVKLTDGPQVNFCKPAVDPLFDTVADIYGASTLGVILTGMGHDGAAGSLRIADAGGSIIAQDEQSSVVWGMPGATAETGACASVLPLKEIGQKVISVLKGRGV